MKRVLKNSYDLLLLVVFNIVVYWPWFLTSKFITYGDFGVWLLNYQKLLIRNAPLIYRGDGFGSMQIEASYGPIFYLYGLLAQFGLDYRIAERLLLLWPAVILTPIFAYKLSYKILKSRAGAVVGTLVALFNTYTLILVNGGTLFAITGALMFGFLYYAYCYFAEGYQKSNLVKLILVAVAMAAYEFRIFYIGVWIVSFFVLFRWLFLQNGIGAENSRRTYLGICSSFCVNGKSILDNSALFD